MESKLNSNDFIKGSKELKTNAKTKECSDALDYDDEVAKIYVKLYEDFDGNIDKIFKEIGENPRKAKKYPPQDAKEFGIKYAQGFYSCLDGK